MSPDASGAPCDAPVSVWYGPAGYAKMDPAGRSLANTRKDSVKKLLLLGVMMLAVASMAWAAESKVTTRGGKPYFETSDNVTAHATVLAINKATRGLTLKSDEGDTVTVNVKPDVKTFDQIKVGDQIKITYTERFTIYVTPSGSAELSQESMRSDAKAGEAPNVAITERTQYKANITAIDTTAHTATLKGYDGKAFTVTPRHPENLKLVKVGDLVVFSYTNTVTAAIEKTTGKAPEKKK